MKRALPIVIISAALLTAQGAGAAGMAGTRIKLHSMVDATCSISSAKFEVNLNTLDIAGGTYAGQSFQQNVLGSAWCNGGHNTIVATVKPLMLVNASNVPDGYTDRIDFSLTIPGLGTLGTSNASPLTGNRGAAENVAAFGEGGAGSLTTSGTGGKKLMEGQYRGEIILTLIPQV